MSETLKLNNKPRLKVVIAGKKTLFWIKRLPAGDKKGFLKIKVQVEYIAATDDIDNPKKRYYAKKNNRCRR
ncbi:MAG: hypothetical protein H0A76_00010 [Candidatus Thiodubiliella endoseptemdiera]|uniref:Uncharacterized protein n=1 Tax=Candidatus Thiodubiliella endoseptemdiera TaxID=2738886 RepID=A0A853F3M6_9GAMM|nr:hypothetical protein [Candidatus Thiodubiliella endoseptemdiera]